MKVKDISITFLISYFLLLVKPVIGLCQSSGSCSINNKYTIVATDTVNGLYASLQGQAPYCEFPASNFNDSGCQGNFLFTDYVGCTVHISATYTSSGFMIFDTGGTFGSYRVLFWSRFNDGPWSPEAYLDRRDINFTVPGTYEFRIEEYYT